MLICCLRTVGLFIAPVLLTVVDETAPDQHSAERFERPRQHVSAFRVVAPVGERPRTMFAVRLDEEARQIGNRGVHHFRLMLPPRLHAFIQRISRRDAVAHRLRIVDGNHQPHAERAENRRELRQIRQIVLNQQLRRVVHVDVVDAQHVQPDGRQHTPQLPHPRGVVGQLAALEEQTAPGISALDVAVGVVPAVNHAQRVLRRRGVILRQCRTRRERHQQPVSAIQQPSFATENRHVVAFTHGMEPFAQRIILGKRNVQIRGERRQCLRKLERGDFTWGCKIGGNISR